MDLNLDIGTIREVLLHLLIMIVSLSLHEWGHAAMADRLGDNTPRSEGRVTLNPLAHIDLLGTIIIPLLVGFGFFGGMAMLGWAKPVYTNPANFRNRTRDQAWVTIAGPGMNLVLAVAATFAAAVASRFSPNLTDLAVMVLQMNVGLIVLNLLPIPPLDGSKFLMYWGGMREETYIHFARWGGLLLLLLLNVPAFRQLVGVLYGFALVPFTALFRILA